MEQQDLIKEARLTQDKETLLSLLLEEDGIDAAVDDTAIAPRKTAENLPLSYTQQGQWFLHQLEPDNPFYNICATVQFEGILDVAALEQSLNEIIRRHEVLRTTFKVIDDQPVQVINPHSAVFLPIVDLQRMPTSEQTAETRRLATEAAQKPFNLTCDRLLRATLLQLGKSAHVLVLVIHHSVADGFTLGILMRELGLLYDAFVSSEPASLPVLPIQYADYAVWQRERLRGERRETLLSYWKQQLEGIPPLLELPSDRPRPATQTFRGDTVSFHIDRALTEQLKALGHASGSTPFMVLLTAFNILLHRYSGQSDIVVGSPIANRNQPELENLIGFFANILILRTQFSEQLSEAINFRELLTQVKSDTLAAYAHQDLPFEVLVEALQPERTLNGNPLFQVMFALQNAPLPSIELPNLTMTPAINFDAGTAKVDLEVHLWEDVDGIHGDWVYSVDLFDRATIQRMMKHFRTLLEAIVANPDQSISRLPLLTPTECSQVLTQWNETQAEYCTDQCIHQRFEAQVDRTPDAIALVFEDQHLTYQALNHRANQLAHHLRSLGVGPKTLVGICVHRSLEMVVGLLGILKAGGAYVPLDPAFPSDRLAFMLEDAQVKVLVTQSDLETVLPTTSAQVVCLDADAGAISTQPTPNPDLPVAPDQLAYVIYTSGSTGKPKGVMIEHQSLMNFLLAMQEAPGLTAADTLLAVTTISFDIAGLELYLPLMVGAKEVLVSPEVAMDAEQLGTVMRQSKTTVMQATPATWRSLLTSGWPADYSLKILCGGEALPQNLAEQLLATGSSLWNLYGPTETTIWSAAKQLDSAHPPITIGRPIANTQFYLLDQHLQPVPIGVTGELYIGGDGLARGYLNRPELTAEKFVRNVFGDSEKVDSAHPTHPSIHPSTHPPIHPSTRLYKTGDLARYLPNGELEILGRIDHQVKLRGFRIELGEIEAVLAEHSAVNQAVVTLREESAGDQRLVAYVAPTLNQKVALDELRHWVTQRLPSYMTPGMLMILEALPLTPNGKIDRLALPVPDWSQSDPSIPFIAPRSSVEQQLADIWANVLRLEQVGIHDNFFELGGHSLLATQVLARMRHALSLNLPLQILFELPTIAKLAGRIEALNWVNPALQKSAEDEGEDYLEGVL